MKQAPKYSTSLISVSVYVFIFAFFLMSLPAVSFALPQGEHVESGDASFSRPDDHTLNITTSDKVIIQWSSFDIASHESVNFLQPSVSSWALNRILGSGATEIAGSLNANGGVIIINPAGINFSQSAQINASSLIASSLNISNSDFLAGRFHFANTDNLPAGLVVNRGNISVSEGGVAALFGGQISNEGKIVAQKGTIALAAGNRVTLTFGSFGRSSLVSVVVDEGLNLSPVSSDHSDGILNRGELSAAGGKIILTAKQVNDVFDHLINQSGIIKANSAVELADGTIELIAIGGSIKHTGVTENLNGAGVRMEARDIEMGGAVHAEKSDYTVSGTWKNIGYSDLGKLSSVEFVDSTRPSYIYGSNQFYNFTSTAPYKTLYFESGEVQNIEGTWHIEGAYGQHIRLLSTQPGSQWFVNPSGVRDISFAWVEDSNNLNSSKIMMTESTNRGNTVNWDPTGIWTNGGATGLWSSPLNWSGLGGSTPGAGDDILFNNTSSANSTVDAPFTILSLNLNGYSGTLKLNQPLTIVGNFSQSSGTLNLNGQTLTVGGNFTRTNGTFTAVPGTINFNGSGLQILNSGGYSYGDLIHSGTGTLQLASYNLISTGSLTNSGGIFDSNTRSITVAGLTSVSGGNYLASTGTQTFNGGLTIAGGTFTGSTGTVDVNGGVSITSGTLNAPTTGYFYVSGNWSNSGGVFAPGTGTVTFDGTNNIQTIDGGASAFGNILHSGSGKLQLLNNPLVIGGNYSNTWGPLDLNGQNVSIAGNWSFSYGSLLGTNSVIFNSAGTQTVYSSSTPFYDLLHSGTGTLKATGTLTIAHQLTNQAGTFDSNFNYVTVNGPAVISGGTFLTSTGTQTFNGGLTIAGGTFTGSTGTVDVNGNVSITSGTLSAPTSGYFYVSGNWSKTGGTFNPGTGTVYFDGTGLQTLDSGGSPFFKINHYASGILELANDLTVTNNFYNSTGTFSLNEHNVTLTGATFTNYGTLRLAGTETLTGFVQDFYYGTWEYRGINDGTPTVITIRDFGATDYNNLRINPADTSDIFQLNNNLLVYGTLSVDGGTLELKGNSLTVYRQFSNNGTVRLYGTEALALSYGNDIDSGNWEFLGNPNASADLITIKDFGSTDYFHLTINSADANDTFRTVTTLTTAGNLTVNSGILDLFNQTTTVGGNFAVNGGSVIVGTSTLIFNKSSGIQTLKSAGLSFYNVTHSGAGTLQLSDAFTVTHNFTNSSGGLDLNGQSWTMTGAVFSNNGTVKVQGLETITGLTPDLDSGAWEFNGIVGGPSVINLPDFGATDYYDLKINLTDPSQVIQLTGPTKIANNLSVDSGILSLNGNDLTVQRTVSNNATIRARGNEAITIPYGNDIDSGTFEYTGNGDGLPDNLVLRKMGTSSTDYFKLLINLTDANDTIQLNTAIKAAGDVTLSSGILNLNNQTLTVSSNFTVAGGVLSATPGTVAFDGSKSQSFDTNNQIFSNITHSGSGKLQLINHPLVMTGNFTNSYGPLALNGQDITVGGNWNFSSGTLMAGTNTVTLNGVGTQTVYGYTPFYNLVHSGTGTLKLTGSLTVSNALTNQAGTFDSNFNYVTVTGPVNVNGGTYLTSTGTQTFNGGLNISGGTFTGSTGTVDVNGNVSITAGTLNAPTTGYFYVSGNWIKTGGVFNPGTGTVTFDGAGLQLLNSGGSSFAKITHFGTGMLQLAGDLTVTSNFTNYAGTFSLSGNNWTMTGATFSNNTTIRLIGTEIITGVGLGSGTVEYSGNGNGLPDVFTLNDLGAIDYYNLRINAIDPNDVYQLGGTIVVSNNLNVDSGILSLNGNNLTVQRTVSNNSTIRLKGNETVSLLSGNDIDSGTWEYNGNGDGLANTFMVKEFSTGSDYFHLLVNLTDANDTLQINSSIKAAGNVTLANGILDVNNQSLTVSGAWSRIAGNLNPGTGTVIFDSSQTQSLDTNGTLFHSITHSGSGKLQLVNSPLVMTGNFSNTYGPLALNGQDMMVGGNWNFNSGTLTAGTNTVTLNGSGTQTVYSYTPFYNLVHSGTGTLKLTGSLTVSNALTNQAGTFDSNFNYVTVTGPVNINGGTYLASTGTQTFNGGLNIAGGTFTGSTGTVDVNGNVSITSGTLNAPTTGYFYISGNWVNAGGIFNAGTGTVTFDGTGTQFLNPGGSSFAKITHSGTGVLQLAGDLTVTSNFTNYAGTFSLNGSNWTMTGATFTNNTIIRLIGTETITGAGLGSGTVEYSGNGNGLPDVFTLNDLGAIDYYNLRINAIDPNDVYQLGGTIVVSNNLNVDSGILSLNGNNLTVQRTVSNNSTIRLRGNETVSLPYGNDIDSGTWEYNGNGDSLPNTFTVKEFSTGTDYFHLLVNLTDANDTLQINSPIKAAGNVTLANGILDVNNQSLTVSGAWNRIAGNLNPGTGTVIFDSSQTQSLDTNGTLFNSVTHSGSGKLQLINSPLVMTGNFTNSSGIFALNNQNITVGGNWNFSSGTFTQGTIPVVFNSAGTQTVSGYVPFYDLLHNGTGTLKLTSALTVSNTLTNADGIFDANANYVTVTGPVALTGGNYLASTGTQTFNGGLNINGGTFTGSTGTVDLNGNLNLTSGTLNAPTAGYFYASANWTQTGGTFNPGTGTVTFDGNGTALVQSIDSGAGVFNHILHSGSGKLQIVNTPLHIGGNFSNTYGPFTLNGFDLTIDGNWNFSSGSFLPGTNQVIFNGAGTQTVYAYNAPFYNLTHSGSGTLKLSNSIAVSNSFFNTNGIFDANFNSFTMSNPVTLTGGNYLASSGTQTFNGGLTINGGTFTGSTGTVNVNGNLNLISGAVNGPTSGSLIINGGLNISGGTFTGSTGTIDLNGNLNLSGGILSTPTTGNFLVSGNWAQTGGTFNSGVGTVTFDGNGAALVQSIDGGGGFNHLLHSGTGKLQIINNPLLINGNFTNTAGTFALNGFDVSVGGNWAFNSGTFLPGTNQVIFSGAGTQTVYAYNAPFYNLTHSGIGTLKLSNSITVSNSFTNSNGIFDANFYPFTANFPVTLTGGTYLASSATQTFNGGLNISGGTFSGSTGTVIINGNLNVISGAVNGPSSGLLTINGNLNISGGAFTALGGTVDLNGNMNLSGGTLSGPTTGYINVSGDWTKTGGIFNPSTGTIVFDGNSGRQYLISGGASFGKIIHSGSGILTLSDNLTVTGSFTNNAGTFDLYGNNWNMTGATFSNNATVFMFGRETVTGLIPDIDSGTWIYSGDFVALQDFGAIDYFNLEIWSANTLGSDLSVAGYLKLLSAGELYLQGHNLSVSKMFTDYGNVYLFGSENVTLSGGHQTDNGSWRYTGNGNGLPDVFTIKDFSGGIDYNQILIQSVDSNDTFRVVNPLSLNRFRLNSGNFDLNGQTMAIMGDSWLKFGGSFISGTGTVSLNYTGVNNATDFQTSGALFYNLIHSGTARVNLLDNLIVTNDFTNSSSTFTSNGFDITVGGNWSFNSGTFASGSNQVNFNGSGTQTVYSNNIPFYNFLHSGSGTLKLSAATIVSNSLTNTNGIFNTNSYSLTVNGPMTLAGGTFTGSSGTVDLNNNLLISNGTFNAPTGLFTISGNWSKTGGAFNPGTGIVTFDGPGLQTLDSGGSSFGKITHSGAGTLQLVNSDLTVTSNFTNSSGIFSLNGHNWTMTGATFSNNGIVRLIGSETITNLNQDIDSGTFEYVGDADGQPDTFSVKVFGSTDYYNLSINPADATDVFQLVDDTVLGNNLTINTGVLFLNGNDISGKSSGGNGTLRIRGDETTLFPSGHDATEGTLELVGDGDGQADFYPLIGGNDASWNVVINAADGLDEFLVITTNTTVSSNLTINATFSGDYTFKVNNDFTIKSGKFTLDSSQANSLILQQYGFNPSFPDQSLRVRGNFTKQGGIFTPDTGSLIMDKASGVQTLDSGGTNIYRLDHTGAGTLQVISPLTITNTFNNTAGVVDLNSQAFSLPNNTSNTATIRLRGSNGNSTNLILGSRISGTIEYVGNGNGLPDTYDIQDDGIYNYFNLVINSTDPNDVFEIPNSSVLRIDGSLTVKSGIFYLNGSNIVDAPGGPTAQLGDIQGTIRLKGNESVFWTTNDIDSGTWEYVGQAGGLPDSFFIKDFGTTDYYNLKINLDSPDTIYLTSQLKIAGNLEVKSGTIDTNGNANTISGTLNISGGAYFSAVPSVTIIDNGSFVQTGGSFTTPNAQFTLSGNFSKTGGAFNAGILDVTFNANSGIQTLDTAGITFHQINHTGNGTLQLVNNPLSVSATFNNIQGTFDANGHDMTVGGLAVNGATFLAGSGTLTFNGGLTNQGSTSVFTAGSGAIDVNGAFTLAGGTFTAPANYLLTVSGNWIHTGGIFNHNNGSVSLDGLDQTIMGSTTFWNLSKFVTSAHTLTFQDNQTQTILGGLILGDNSGNVLSLRSLNTGNYWYLNTSGGAGTYVDVRDSYNLNVNPMNAHHSIDSSHNVNWSFS